MSIYSRISAIITGLGPDPTPAQLEYALRGYNKRDILMWQQSEPGSGLPDTGQAEPQAVLRLDQAKTPNWELLVDETTETITLNTANNWTSAWFTLDVGAPAGIARYLVSLASFDGDGETYGVEGGQVYVRVFVEHADEGGDFADDGNGVTIGGDGSPTTLARLVLTLRHRRFQFRLYSGDTQELYAGANEPIAGCELYAAVS